MQWGDHPRRRTTPEMWRKPLRWNKRAAPPGIAPACSAPPSRTCSITRSSRPGVPTSGSSSARRPPSIGCSSPNVRRISARCFRLTGPTAGRTSGSARRGGTPSTIVSAGRFSPASRQRCGSSPTSRRSHRSVRSTSALASLPIGLCGGESGGQRRPLQTEWVREVRDQCEAHGIRFLFKQHGGLRWNSGGCELDGREWRMADGGVSAGREWSRLIATAKTPAPASPFADRCPCLRASGARAAPAA